MRRNTSQNRSMIDSNASTRSPAHEQLRSSTRDLHQAVDSRFDLASMSTEAAYTAFLLASWPSASIEVALERAGIQTVLADWGRRRRRDDLAEDIRQRGVSLPSIDRIEIDPDHGALLGWTYVLEGSRLGAGMILQATKRHGETQIEDVDRGGGCPILAYSFCVCSCHFVAIELP